MDQERPKEYITEIRKESLASNTFENITKGLNAPESQNKLFFTHSDNGDVHLIRVQRKVDSINTFDIFTTNSEVSAQSSEAHIFQELNYFHLATISDGEELIVGKTPEGERISVNVVIFERNYQTQDLPSAAD